jgi:hypothetical protein
MLAPHFQKIKEGKVEDVPKSSEKCLYDGMATWLFVAMIGRDTIGVEML